ncbi:uncharacterized [Tachysurus ichikawai]
MPSSGPSVIAARDLIGHQMAVLIGAQPRNQWFWSGRNVVSQKNLLDGLKFHIVPKRSFPGKLSQKISSRKSDTKFHFLMK